MIHAQLTENFLDRIAELARVYFHLEVEGLEHVPARGRALIVPNHCSVIAADALMIAHLIHHDAGRVPKILAHKAFFGWFKALRRLSLAFGLEEVSVHRGVELLKRDELVLVFPEGESGNFKSSSRRYHLQHFHTGFLRMAIESGSPLIPCLVLGAEEGHVNLGSIDCSRFFKGLRLPLPLNLLPLPTKWTIRFLEPIRLDRYPPGRSNDRALLHELGVEIQIAMQRELNRELWRREKLAVPAETKGLGGGTFWPAGHGDAPLFPVNFKEK